MGKTKAKKRQTQETNRFTFVENEKVGEEKKMLKKEAKEDK